MSWESFPFLVPCKNVCRIGSSFCPSIHGFLRKTFLVLSFQIFHDSHDFMIFHDSQHESQHDFHDSQHDSQHDFIIFHDSQQLHETQD